MSTVGVYKVQESTCILEIHCTCQLVVVKATPLCPNLPFNFLFSGKHWTLKLNKNCLSPLFPCSYTLSYLIFTQITTSNNLRSTFSIHQVRISTDVGWFCLFPHGFTKSFSYINSSIRSHWLSNCFRNQSYLKLTPFINHRLLSWAVCHNDGLYGCRITDLVTVRQSEETEKNTAKLKLYDIQLQLLRQVSSI